MLSSKDALGYDISWHDNERPCSYCGYQLRLPRGSECNLKDRCPAWEMVRPDRPMPRVANPPGNHPPPPRPRTKKTTSGCSGGCFVNTLKVVGVLILAGFIVNALDKCEEDYHQTVGGSPSEAVDLPSRCGDTRYTPHGLSDSKWSEFICRPGSKKRCYGWKEYRHPKRYTGCPDGELCCPPRK